MKTTSLRAAVFAAALALSGCMVVDLSSLRGSKELTEITVQKAEHRFVSDKVLLADVSGIIADADDGGLFSDLTCAPTYLKAVLNKAEQDASVKAVVLRLNSPGGGVAASELMAREVSAYRQRTRVPVIAQIGSLGCSGAYYIAAGADRILAQPSSVVGSIGVMAVLPKYRKLADKIGYEQVVIKSGAMKDLGSGMREMTEDERAVFQGIIDADCRTFLDWILAHRPQIGDRTALTALADGRIYTAQQAVDHKLIDAIGYLDDALAAARQAAGLRDARVVTYVYAESADANIYTPRGSSAPLRVGTLDLPLISGAAHRAGFYYLWMPGE